VSTVPPADFGLDFQVRKSVHAVQIRPASADLTLRGRVDGCGN
jgi:hypothetical protein